MTLLELDLMEDRYGPYSFLVYGRLKQMALQPLLYPKFTGKIDLTNQFVWKTLRTSSLLPEGADRFLAEIVSYVLKADSALAEMVELFPMGAPFTPVNAPKKEERSKEERSGCGEEKGEEKDKTSPLGCGGYYISVAVKKIEEGFYSTTTSLRKPKVRSTALSRLEQCGFLSESAKEYQAAKWWYDSLRKDFPKRKFQPFATLKVKWIETLVDLQVKDGHSWDEIRFVLYYGRVTSDFWKQNCQALPKLRRNTKDGLSTYFALMLEQAHRGE